MVPIKADRKHIKANLPKPTVKAKFHYASWFGAGSKLVRTR